MGHTRENRIVEATEECPGAVVPTVMVALLTDEEETAWGDIPAKAATPGAMK